MKKFQVEMTEREGRMIRSVMDGEVKVHLVGDNKSIVLLDDLAQMQAVCAKVHTVREIASRGDKMVYTKIFNSLPVKFANAVARQKKNAEAEMEALKKKIEQAAEGLDYFLDRKVDGDRVVVRLRPTNGKHGEASLTKFYIKPVVSMKLGKVETEFEVRGNDESLVVPTMDIADEIVADFARMWVHNFNEKNAARVNELKAELAAMQA